MNWHRIANRQWQSDCGDYYIQAFCATAGYSYAAVYNPDDRRHIGLGMFEAPDSVENAQAAKQACINHKATLRGVAA